MRSTTAIVPHEMLNINIFTRLDKDYRRASLVSVIFRLGSSKYFQDFK